MFGTQASTADLTSNWIRVYDELRSRIKSGELRAEASIDISMLQNYPQDALHIALRRLTDEGLLKLGLNNSLEVAKPKARSRRSASFQVDYSNQGRTPTTKTLSLEVKPINQTPEFVQKSFGESELGMQLVLRHYHIQSVDNVPHAIADSYIPFELISSRFDLVQKGDHDTFRHLKILGHQISHKEETLYVDVPTLEERQHLQIVAMPDLQVVRLDCLVWSEEKLVEVCLLTDRADLYEFNYRIKV